MKRFFAAAAGALIHGVCDARPLHRRSFPPADEKNKPNNEIKNTSI